MGPKGTAGKTGTTATTSRPVGAVKVGRGGKAALVVIVLAVVGLALAACSSSPPDPVAAKPTCGGSSPKLTVQGTGLATGTPNILTVDVGIDVTDATAQQALADDDSKASRGNDRPQPGRGGGQGHPDHRRLHRPPVQRQGGHHRLPGLEHPDGHSPELHHRRDPDRLRRRGRGNSTRLDSLTFSVEDTRSLEDRARTEAPSIRP